MRAAMSHKFGRELERGTVPWTEHPVQPGKYVGNPSLSPKVSQYMVSLQRRKVWFPHMFVTENLAYLLFI
jgi:hypothetical protein